MSNEQKLDDYGNLITGLAGPVDKDVANVWADPLHLSHVTLSHMYTGSGLNQRIVGKIVDDATRGGFEICGKTMDIDMDQVNSDIEDYKIVETVNKFGKTTRLYGGALLYADVEDGGEPDDPLDTNNVTQVYGFKVIPSFRAYPQGYNSSLGLDGWMNPEYYRLQTEGSTSQMIHSSRCFRLDALKILDPDFLRFHQGWGPSTLESIFPVLARLGASEQYMASLMHNMSMMIVKIPEIHKQMCGGKEQRQKGEQALEALRMLADNYHWMAMGTNDEIMELKRDLTGFNAISDKMVEAAIRETGMARIIFSGEQAGGLNSNASDEIRGWYDLVDAYRKETLRCIYNWMLTLYFKARENNGLSTLDKWTLEFPSLWQESPAEQRDAQKIVADTWAAYVTSCTALLEAQIYSPEEIKSLLNRAMKELKMPLDPSFIPIIVKPSGSVDPLAPETLEANVDDEALAETGDLPSDPITTKEAGQKWPISTVALNNLCRSGALRHWKIGGKYIISLSEMLNHIRGGKMDSTNFVRDLKQDGADSVGLFIRVPKSISNQYPLIKEVGREIPHHITVAILENAYWNKEELIKTLEDLLKEVPKFTASIQGDSLTTLGEHKATVAPVTFEPDFKPIRQVLVAALESKGFSVSKKYPEWNPHVTITYDDFEGEVLNTSFEVKQIEIWGLGGDPISVNLG